MQDKIDKPIFVVGSPRSGTSILTWCLGQHPNILVQPESNWIGRFAVDVAIGHETGSARGERSQLSALDIRRDDFMAHFGKSINDLILSHRRQLQIKSRSAALRDPSQIHEGFRIARSQSDPKSRWVDGTPEYSFYICGLRKLFPKALFIHIVRDVTSVVRSMLNFERVGEGSLVPNEQDAYNYWFRTVSSCLLAERAYGPRVVFRLRYSDLVDAPEAAMRSVLKFVGERYAVACLNPLQERINSSNVPADFTIGDPETDPALVERATRLCIEIERTPQPSEASPAAAEEMEAAFEDGVRYAATVDSEYNRAQQIVASLQKEQAKLQAEHERLQAEHERLQAEHERGIAKLTERMRQQLRETKKLVHLLAEVENAAARLRSSRRWKLANPVTAIKARLSPNKVSLGYGHLEKIVASYLQWRTSHPEIAKIDDQIKMLAFPTTPKSSEIDPAHLAKVTD